MLGNETSKKEQPRELWIFGENTQLSNRHSNTFHFFLLYRCTQRTKKNLNSFIMPFNIAHIHEKKKKLSLSSYYFQCILFCVLLPASSSSSSFFFLLLSFQANFSALLKRNEYFFSCLTLRNLFFSQKLFFFYIALLAK